MKLNYSLVLSLAFICTAYADEATSSADCTEDACVATRAVQVQCALCNCMVTVTEQTKEAAVCACHNEVDGRAAMCMCEQMAENCQGCRVVAQDEQQAEAGCCQKKSQN